MENTTPLWSNTISSQYRSASRGALRLIATPLGNTRLQSFKRGKQPSPASCLKSLPSTSFTQLKVSHESPSTLAIAFRNEPENIMQLLGFTAAFGNPTLHKLRRSMALDLCTRRIYFCPLPRDMLILS